MPAPRRWLRAGDRFKLHRDCFPSAQAFERQPEWEVIAVTPASAKVRRLAGRYTRIETYDGTVAEFEAPDRATHFSPTASVILV